MTTCKLKTQCTFCDMSKKGIN